MANFGFAVTGPDYYEPLEAGLKTAYALLTRLEKGLVGLDGPSVGS